MNKYTDNQLFSAIKNGSKIALSELFNRFYNELKHYGNYVSTDPVIAEECIQELFIYIFEAHERLGDVKNVKSYLFTSLRRRLIETVRRRRTQKARDLEIMTDVDVQFMPHDVQEIIDKQRLSSTALTAALNNLSHRQREAIYLRYYNSLTTREISEVMGVANQTILNTLHQGLKRIRKDESLRELLR